MRKVWLYRLKVELILLCAVLAGTAAACGGSPAPVPAKNESSADQLDAAIRETSNYLNAQLPKGNKLVILNVQSEFPALSEYIIDELIANTVNDRVFSVVDRQQLNTIRAELDFQMSGEVDDATAQALGRMAGAQIIISGAISKIGDLYRLRLRALSVQSAEIAAQFNRNIPDNSTISALVKSRATGYGNAATASGAGSRTPASAPAVTSAPVPAQASAPAPAPAPTPTYKIGDKGPAGGFVFYDKGVVTNGWRYLEAAPADLRKTQWQSSATDVSGTMDTVGSGKENTQLAIRHNVRAAMACQQYSQGGFSDWFLPSKAELDLMYINLKMIRDAGNFISDWYWSSTQYNTGYAWTQHFSDGQQSRYYGKDSNHSVRPVRQF